MKLDQSSFERQRIDEERPVAIVRGCRPQQPSSGGPRNRSSSWKTATPPARPRPGRGRSPRSLRVVGIRPFNTIVRRVLPLADACRRIGAGEDLEIEPGELDVGLDDRSSPSLNQAEPRTAPPRRGGPVPSMDRADSGVGSLDLGRESKFGNREPWTRARGTIISAPARSVSSIWPAALTDPNPRPVARLGIPASILGSEAGRP